MVFRSVLFTAHVSFVLSAIVGLNMHFKRVNAKNLSMVTFLNLTIKSKISCAAQCNQQPKDCYSYTYNNKDKSCSIGSWLIESNTSLDSNTQMYTVGAYCNVTNGFQVLTKGTSSACVRVSNGVLNYMNSHAACKGIGIGVDLYTMKYAEKYHLIKSFFQKLSRNVWVGLDDIDVENVFKSSDDGSVQSQELRKLIFAPGEPNDGKNGNCVLFYIALSGFVDGNCAQKFYYLCERSPQVEIDL